MDTESRLFRITPALLLGGITMSVLLSGASVFQLLGGVVGHTASVISAIAESPVHIVGLEVNPLLQRAAEAKARDMAERGYMAHVGPDGKTPADWVNSVGYTYGALGEELSVQFDGGGGNKKLFSSDFRKGMLDKNFTDIGIGSAEGYLEGRPATFFVHFFAQSK